MRNRLTEMFGIDVPIFAFTHKPEVAIEVTNGGGMGALAASYYQPDELERILTDMDEKTRGRPYCIDVLFANKVGDVVPMSERLKALPKGHLDFVEKILDDAGIPPLPPEVEAELLRDKPPGRGRAEHALKHVQAGVDLVVAQGSEAGGHTGTISSMVLWPEVVDAVAPIPVLAAGGVGSGRHIAAAFALGAEGVWCGTIWLGAVESELSPDMRKKFIAARSQDAIQRKYDTGKPLRGLRSNGPDAWYAPG